MASLGKKTRLYGLRDVLDPSEQGGSFKRDFDSVFWNVAQDMQVPFCLLKAHAIAESSLDPQAYVDESNQRADRKGWASRGLMQVLWWPGSNRFDKYGFPDSEMMNGDLLFDPDVNVTIAAHIISDNLRSSQGNIRDAINMYNTGKKEAQYQAPGGYVDKVLGFYNQLLGGL